MDERDVILVQAVAVLAPFIMVFGFYVIIHGHLSPGGGFAGGTIIAAALILNTLSRRGFQLFDAGRLLKYISVPLILYSLLKAAGTFFPESLHGIVSKGVPGNLLSGGLIIPLNLAVGMVVACAMYLLFTRIGGGGT